VGFGTLQLNNNGLDNTAVGVNSLLRNSGGLSNTAVGSGTLQANDNGQLNTAVGVHALTLSSSNYNTAIGGNSMQSNTSGEGNTGLGLGSLGGNTEGNYNTAAGLSSLGANTEGNLNAAFGYGSSIANTTGIHNASYGASSLATNTAGSRITVIGAQSDVSQDNLTKATAIGFGAIVNASNKVRIGNSAVTVIEGAVAFTTPSDGRFKFNVREDVAGLDFILKLRPVTYQLDTRKLNDHARGLSNPSDYIHASYNEATILRRTGFIAQEVDQAATETGFDFSGVNKPKSATDHFSLSYESFVVPLVKAVQEQQSVIAKQEEEIKKLKVQLEALAKAVQTLSSNK
jgi:hypothetical protein